MSSWLEIVIRTGPAIGLSLNFVGTVLLACSFGKNIAEAQQIDEDGRKVYLASFLRPRWFRIGLFLSAIGFLLQLVAQVIGP